MNNVRTIHTKHGDVFEIRISRGRDKTPAVKRWTPPEKWSQKAIERELNNQIHLLKKEVEAGAYLDRKMKKQMEEEARKEQEHQRLEEQKLLTVRRYSDNIFMPTKEASFSENARSSYRMFLDKHIFPAIGDFKLTDIKPSMLKKLLSDFQKTERTTTKKDGTKTTKKGYAHATCIKLYNILNGIFEMAFQDDSIPVNPMLKVPRPKPSKDDLGKDESDKAYTAQELAHILNSVKEEPLKWQTYINLSADTACRKGELCGLQWNDVDWETGAITIKRNLQYTRAKGVYVTTPKNGKTRTVDVGEETLTLLRRLRAEQAASSDRIRLWVFTQDGTDDPMHPHSPNRYFKKFGEKYSVEDFHPHKLRHSFASIALTNGADIVSISERLGHSDTAVTLRMYAHANEESIRRAGQTARDAIAKHKQA